MKLNRLRVIMKGPTIAAGGGTVQVWHSRSNYIAVGETLQVLFSIVTCKSRVSYTIDGKRHYRFDCVVRHEMNRSEVQNYFERMHT